MRVAEEPPRVGRARVMWMGVTLAAIVAAPVGAAPTGIRPGAIELGMAGALVSVEGSTRSTVGLRAGFFFGAPRGLAGLEAEAQFHHQRSLDEVELQASLSWQRPLAEGAAYPFAAVGGGVRQETIGSFSQARYPVGLALGVRVLFGSRAAARVEYRHRRMLGDPVRDYTEHQVLTGFSLLLRNDVPGAGEGR